MQPGGVTWVWHVQEMYLFANDGENHTNNVKQLENMKKAIEEKFQPPRLGPGGDAEDPWSADLSRTGL